MELTSRFEDALAYTTRLHRTQMRKGSGVPYMSHLLGVTSLVLTYGADEDEAIAALLHDAVEDQGGPETREAIRQRFGGRVAEIVDGCTDSDETPKPPWRERKEAYIAHLREAAASVRLVSAADKLHNARAIARDYRIVGEDVWRRFRGGREGTLWYYAALVDVLSEAGGGAIVEELRRTVEELQGLLESPAHEGIAVR
jgi:(p)ppGpp synthase/HD superfamily hydrolase